MLAILRSLAFILLTVATGSAAAESPLDMRLVVDISGSMKQNDPNNLRRPAVRLITELLPDGTHAGVWTFGQYVNMLVPHGAVDGQWRQSALALAPRINSAGLRTNIGGALEVASDDFYQDQRRDNTHFILLTDGMVDVTPPSRSDAVARNRAERARILKEVLPRLIAKGAQVHAIALSGNADLALLKQIAQASGGSYGVAETDQSLSRVFLEALESARPSKEVPLTGNRFLIDSSVQEFTAVIFHEPGAAVLGLKTPSGETHSAAQTDAIASAKDAQPRAMRWLTGADYTLVTVESPEGGEWEIIGEMGSGSRVKVVSDLSLEVSDLPRYFFASEELPLNVQFESGGNVLKDPEFLKFITVTVKLLTGDGRTGMKTLSSAGQPPEDGIYRDLISRLTQPGEYTFTVTGDGGTFQRQSRQTIVLRPPMDVTVNGEGTGAESRQEIRVRVNQPDLVPDTARVKAQIEGPDGFPVEQPLQYSEDQDEWSHSIAASQGKGEYKVVVELEGDSIEGKPVRFSSAPFSVELPRQTTTPDYQAVEPLPVSETPQPETAQVADEQPDLVQPDRSDDAEVPAPGAASAVPDLARADRSSSLPAESLAAAVATDPPTEVPAGDSQTFAAWALWLGAGLCATVLLAGGWLLWRKRGNVREDTSETEAPVPTVEASPEEPEAQAEEETILETDAPEIPEARHDSLTEEDADAVIARVMADAGDDGIADGQIQQDKSEADDDDEFSLEDFDLSETDDLPLDEAEDGGSDRPKDR